MGLSARIVRLGVLLWTVAMATASLSAGPASAKTCTRNIAPPGHAGSTQYYETVPTSCGNASPPAGGSGSSRTSIGRLGKGTAGSTALSRLGIAGQSAAALAEATAPALVIPARFSGDASSRGYSGHRHGGGAVSGGAMATDLPSASGSAVGALGNALTDTGGGGLGIFLPILLALIFAAAVAAGFGRARRQSGPST